MTSLPLGRVVERERRALRDRVYDRILEMLLMGELESGMRLSPESMAKLFDVSPTPVREAMVQLERTGLVTREALRGYRVAPPLDEAQLAELYEARLMIETTAMRSAAAEAGKVVPALREAHEWHLLAAEAVIKAHGRGDVPLELTHDYFRADTDFHLVPLEHLGNRYIRGMYEDLGALTHRMRQLALRGPDDVHEAVAEHAAILAAFERGDEEACVSAMRAHIENARDRSLRHGTD